MNYHRTVACLSLQGNPKGAFAIHDLIRQYPHISISELVCSYLYCDFMWIEVTQELLQAAWYPQFTQSLQEVKLDKLIPIIMVSFSQAS
jgi:hypothetical protein